ncbi:MAG: sensor of ECF-type sigma factor [Flavobacterium sp.]|uniref:sensor of ECF-type sigma factor n=1 Tax=Flavobacterium sp. TaxID=239 RepID=UPI0011FB14B3|nr:sensor of ECF-type sigma factor [Flavobacterium sp.]RZJ67578.1 MAG: sensor of ECF-type sigma factor [Flavobacterium sp.]
MKTKQILTILLTFASCAIFAQGGRLKEKKEQLKSVKVAFITEALELTSDEAQKFWPIYNTFEDKQFELRKDKLDAYRKRMNESLTDKEASTLLTQMESTEDELHQLRKKLVADLRGVIGPVKIIKLNKAEEDFKSKLLKQYRDRKRE